MELVNIIVVRRKEESVILFIPESLKAAFFFFFLSWFILVLMSIKLIYQRENNKPLNVNPKEVFISLLEAVRQQR